MAGVVDLVTEHAFMSALLFLEFIGIVFMGYLVYRVHRSAERIEGLTAATYLEARKALTQQR